MILNYTIYLVVFTIKGGIFQEVITWYQFKE